MGAAAGASVAYPETLEAAMPSRERVAEAAERLKAAGVETLFSCWVDLQGLPKTKPVPVSELETLCRGKGPQFGVHSVSMVPELGPADPDQVALPDLDSLMICPWDTKIAWVFADLFFLDKPYNVCPRLTLKREVRKAADAGYRFFAGLEPEFMVLRYADGRPVKAIDDDPLPGAGLRPRRQPFGYDAEFSFDGMPFLSDVTACFGTLGWDMKNVVCEGAYSQFELDFGYADLLRMADRFTFLRVMLKQIAKRHGLFVTYMPKPMQGDWRNGAHINHSVQAIDRPGVNLFEGADGDWSETALNALGGLIRHGGALTALACPTVNSYKGLVGRAEGLEGGTLTWAPTHMCYGRNNRSAMFRLPQPRKAIENRAADMCQNVYLSLAMTGAASLEGMQQKLPAGMEVKTSLYDTSPAELAAAGIQRLPTNLLESITLLDRDELAKAVLGPTMHGMYVRLKREEWHRFHAHVTEWEQAEYLRFF